ncbi:MAG: VWA domain-containing protein [Myxococcota bacterium]
MSVAPAYYQAPVAYDTVHGELPAHRFAAREHLARVPLQRAPVEWHTLPDMVRSNRCVEAGAVVEGRPPRPSKSKANKRAHASGTGKAPGHVRYNSTDQRTTTAAIDTNSTPEPQPRSAQREDKRLLDLESAARRPAEPTPPPEPAAPTMYTEGPTAEPDPAPAEDSAPAFTSRRSSRGDKSTRTRARTRASRDAAGISLAGTTGAEDFRAINVEANEASFSERQAATRSRRRARRARRKAERAHERAMAASAPRGHADIPQQSPPVMVETVVVQPEWPPYEEGWGAATYLSNDDTMSLSSAQRVMYAIDQHLPLAPEHVRPHELLNYFSFETGTVDHGDEFAVHGEIGPSQRTPGMLALGLSIASHPVGREGRRNAALTLVIDRSGSMRAEGRMEYLKRGLLRMVRELDNGDIINVVTFDHRVCNPLSNFVVGRDDIEILTKTIHKLRPSGSTNLHAGLTRGYQMADAAYQPKYTNRVLLISDAIANRGETNPRTLAMVSDWFDARRIRLSGIGVGREFNDELLDRLTEKGRGAYVFLGSEAEVDAVFGHRFPSLIETVANDVHFRLHLPPSLRVEQFHGEEASEIKADVQAVHFFADTSQLMLAEVEPWQGQLRRQDEIMLEIEYQDPETGELLTEEHIMPLGELADRRTNITKGELIMHFVEAVGRQARREIPSGWEARAGTWHDPEALADCSQTRLELQAMAEGNEDPEVTRVLSLWDGYCARFESAAPRRPSRKGVDDRWPGASR